MGAGAEVIGEAKPVILFDGVCNLCNSSVQFIINRDPQVKFHFAALQSETGGRLLQSSDLPTQVFQSIVLIKNGTVYQKSDAALEIARQLSGLWPALYAFKIVPPFFRDFVYNQIAKNRYGWFGKKDHCMIPTPQLKSRFL